MIREQGWECPKCQRVWAPRIAACGACNTEKGLKPHPIPQFLPSYVPETFNPPWRIGDFPQWNYTADDFSYSHQDGDPA